MAIVNASQTSLAGMLGAMAQPTTLRAYKSSTVARYSQPAPVRMYVMSLTYARFGALGSVRIFVCPKSFSSFQCFVTGAP